MIAAVKTEAAIRAVFELHDPAVTGDSVAGILSVFQSKSNANLVNVTFAHFL
jgi:hypothetical protein